MIQLRGLMLLIAFALGFATHVEEAWGSAAPVACDPFRDQIHRAQALIAQRNFIGASQILGKIIASDPKNVMANFLLGTIKLGQPGASSQQAGFGQLQFAVAQIQDRPENCARELGWYSLYITLGAQYYQRQDVPNAKSALQTALAHRNALAVSSQEILFDDLGRIALAQGNLNDALSYYSQGAKLGNRNSIIAVANVKRMLDEGGRK